MKRPARPARLFLPACLCVLFTLQASAGSDRATRISNAAQARLQSRLQAILAQPDLSRMTTGVLVVSLDTGDTLFAHQADRLFHPASNTKLFTAVSALRTLGPDYRFLTIVYGDGDVWLRGDTLHTSLYLYGTGDPLLNTADLDSLAGCIAAYGVRTVAGDIVVDDAHFDDVRLGEGWMWDDVAYDYSAQISAVTLNRNCVTVLVAPGDTVGSPVRVQLDPPTDYMRVLVEARTGPASASDSADAEPLRVERRWQERQNVLEVTGVLPLGAEERRVIRTVEDPGRYAATVFRERLAGHGISVTGETRAGRTPLRARVLASHRSEPLTAAVSFMLKESDNLAAELLVKAMGAYRSGRPGATPDGLRAVQGVLTEIAGLDTLQYRFADGSGLSWYNLVAPDQTMRLLMSAYRDSTLREPLLAALPVAGVDGTLKNRMRSSPAEGTLRAKTGTLSGASCLSGFVRTRDGETVAFSIMMNHFVGSSATARRTQDAIGALLAGFSRSRGAEEKGSKGAGMSNER